MHLSVSLGDDAAHERPGGVRSDARGSHCAALGAECSIARSASNGRYSFFSSASDNMLWPLVCPCGSNTPNASSFDRLSAKHLGPLVLLNAGIDTM